MDGEEKRHIPQGLKAEWFVYGLKPSELSKLDFSVGQFGQRMRLH